MTDPHEPARDYLDFNEGRSLFLSLAEGALCLAFGLAAAGVILYLCATPPDSAFEAPPLPPPVYYADPAANGPLPLVEPVVRRDTLCPTPEQRAAWPVEPAPVEEVTP